MVMNIVILGAGQGKRMKSSLPKVLHPLAGKPMLAHVLDAVKNLSDQSQPYVVIGHGGEQVEAFLGKNYPKVRTAIQKEQKGTGHAVDQAMPQIDNDGITLILYGDVPLIQTNTLQKLIQLAEDGAFALLTQNMANPSGYGRIVRDTDGAVIAIVEEKDADQSVKEIKEINTGLMALPTKNLKQWLKRLQPNNAQGEYYLTDIIGMSVAQGMPVRTTQASFAWETVGVNSRSQMAELERQWQAYLASQLLDAGVALADPTRIDIRGTLSCLEDVQIDIGCVFEGHVSLGRGVKIGPYCVIKNVEIEDGARIHAFSHLESAHVGQNAIVGPYARLRPGTELAKDSHVGNFVEIKNSQIGEGSKANHLAYVGDATVGQRVNIGAGTITCNYDGVNKHRTVIEDDAFIGSDTQLVAPVTVGRGATLGAGTTLTKDAPADQLTVSRTKQISLAWKRPVKSEKK
jgi:bifunctional UDP-N-acetylglucosamine pyrophosphorylase/glucosamine-1-phosphate N-acetyltransferase